ncbi:hypothetical protein P7F60_28925 [Rhizobium sp. YJ-22]|uniref:hypothetical protein n=1 Tax=Rhizobium sp. YJ-22 TaxID=3037556 RepID=UPI0024124F28|nr:hypothetical protein [Rhizobium sp. YJ-22]MDG3580407.1 hypothetical protein [Rhizobium sp. YJ-22]
MKREIFAASLIAFSLVGIRSGAAADWPPASDYLFIADDCSTADDPERCKNIKAIWERDYNDAIKGGYQGQRNVSFCLSTGCNYTEFRKNVVLGCAWRVVIVNSGHLDANELDAQNLKLYCGSQFLDDTGRVMADAQARTIMEKLGIPVQLK